MMGATCVIHGQVWDGTGREPIPDGFVLVRDGRIAEVGRARDFSRGKDEPVEVIEADGRTVIPGLIDCHAHLIYAGYRSFLDVDRDPLELATLKAARNARVLVEAGYTTIRDVGTRGNIAAVIRDAVQDGLIPGPRILAAGPIITTTGGHSDLHPAWLEHRCSVGVVVDGPWEVVRAVREQVKAGVDLIKVGGSGAEPSPFCFTWMSAILPEEIQAAVATARRYGKRVAFHGQALESTRDALRAGIDTLEHGTRLDEECVSLMKARGTILVPTLCTLFSVVELGEQLQLAPKQRDEMAINRPLWLESLRLAREAGVPIAAGGDVGNRFPQGTNAREIAYLAANGLGPVEALRAATAVAARALGLEDEVGTLEPGKAADLLVVDGDPLADPGVLRQTERIRLVLKAGQVVARQAEG
jgi:imidazolonepropionase-like amidohydrolase